MIDLTKYLERILSNPVDASQNSRSSICVYVQLNDFFHDFKKLGPFIYFYS